LIIGLDQVGVEIAKNIALSGVKVLGLADNRKVTDVNTIG
jgi:molybdopterin/thiamine biosynthesis adenylyltransferase